MHDVRHSPEVVAQIARAAEIARTIARAAAANHRYEDAVWFEAQAAGADERARRLTDLVAKLRLDRSLKADPDSLLRMADRPGSSALPLARHEAREHAALRGVPAGRAQRPTGAAGLTRRQIEVARLIARGYTNRRIAEALTISPGTAANHVEHILNRLSCSSRAQVAAWAVEQGLLDGHAEPG